MNSEVKDSHGRALVIGASISGLLAARALANHYEQVTLIERDQLPPPGDNRKAIPQGKHVHVLLERGHQIMETYLPGLTEDLRRLGAVQIKDVSANMRWFHSGGYHQPGKSGISGLAASRPTLETALRRRVLQRPNISLIECADVAALQASPDKSTVTGVALRRQGSKNDREFLAADLVVDAGGRGSRSPAWLESLGYQRPTEEEIEIDLEYVSCFFCRCPEDLPGLSGIVMMATPPDRRVGVLLAQDGDRWVLTLGNYLGDRTSNNFDDFMASVRQLPMPDIYHVVKDAEPLGEPVAYRFSSSRRRRYDRLTAFPNRYVILGDALCSFNPIYGQGMTVAALEAQTLDSCLKEGKEVLAQRFFTESRGTIDLAWNAAVGTDLSYSEVEGPRTPMIRFLNWYLSKLHLAAQRDEQVSIAFLRVINMVAPPTTLLHPRIFARVMKSSY